MLGWTLTRRKPNAEQIREELLQDCLMPWPA